MAEELTDYLKAKFDEIHQNETQTLQNQMVSNGEHQNYQQQQVEETNKQQNLSTVCEKDVDEQNSSKQLLLTASPNSISNSNESGVIKFAKELIDLNNNNTFVGDDHDKMVDTIPANTNKCDDNNNDIVLSFQTDELPVNNKIDKIIDECNESMIQDVVDDNCKIKNETTSDSEQSKIEESSFDLNSKSKLTKGVLKPEQKPDNSIEINVEKNDCSSTIQPMQTGINCEVENNEKNNIPIMTETTETTLPDNQFNLDESVEEKESIESGIHSDECSDATDIRSSSSQSTGQPEDNENIETKQSHNNSNKSIIRSISNNETNSNDAVDGTNLPASISRSMSTKTVNFKMESIKEEKVVTRKRVSELCDFWQNRGIIDKKPEQS